MMVVLFSTFFSSFAGGLMMVVLCSTFFSSFAGGVMMVVFFSTTFSGGVVFTRESQAARRNAAAERTMMDFILGMGCGIYFFSVVVVVVVVFFSKITGAWFTGTSFTTTFRTMTFVATILSPTFV